MGSFRVVLLLLSPSQGPGVDRCGWLMVLLVIIICSNSKSNMYFIVISAWGSMNSLKLYEGNQWAEEFGGPGVQC